MNWFKKLFNKGHRSNNNKDRNNPQIPSKEMPTTLYHNKGWRRQQPELKTSTGVYPGRWQLRTSTIHQIQ